jgi:UPF0042 nucleotide-binding protein
MPPPETLSEPLDMVILTGLSGAGRTTAIHALEDIGWEAVDNLPIGMISRLIDPSRGAPLAVGVDGRTRDFSAQALIDEIETLRRRADVALRFVFLDCADEALLRRFAETRRRHPMAPEESAAAGLARERAIMAALMERADVVIDTTAMSPHDLKARIQLAFGRGGAGLAVALQSFSFKRGAPRDADMTFDVRFLRNPHWDEALRPLDGRDSRVDAFVAADPLFTPFFERLADMVLLLLPAYKREGKAYLGVGIGCSGGRHRSVATVERLGRRLAEAGWPATVRHRELETPARGGDA